MCSVPLCKGFVKVILLESVCHSAEFRTYLLKLELNCILPIIGIVFLKSAVNGKTKIA